MVEIHKNSCEAGPVTISIERKIILGCEAEYENWLKRITSVALEFPGHMGVNVIRPTPPSREYVTIFRFDSYQHSKAWEDSDVRREWLKKLNGIVEGEDKVRKGTGLEFWFNLPELPVVHPSPHKMAVVLLVVVFTMVTAIHFVLSFFSTWWPTIVKTFVTVFFQVILMTYVVMPRVTRLLRRWLFRQNEQS